MATELTDLTAAELAERIRSRQSSAVEVVGAHLGRIEAINPAINAVVTLDADRALEAARNADAAVARGDRLGPLHGVPITIKDGFATAGLRTTFGLYWYGQRLDRYVPAEDAPSVAALRRAGAVVLGKTNLPFASYDWQSRHPMFGRANNPHALDRTPGGSSGGGAAAVAAGLSPLDLASDVAGSIRVPAHFCGACALRPTEGLVSVQDMVPPGHPGSLRHALVAGPMARSVADLRLGLAALLTRHAPDPSPAELRDLRIAYSPTVAGAPVSRGVKRAIEAFLTALDGAGCRVVEATPPVDFAAAQRTWGLVQGFEFAAGLPYGLGRAPFHWLYRLGLVRLAFGPGDYSRSLARGYSASPAAYFRALAERDRLVRAFAEFFERWDLWICPVAGVTAFPHRRTGASLELDGAKVPYAEPLGVFNTGTALAGTPSVTLPIGRDDGGLPVAVQIHADRGQDFRLLDQVERLEEVGGAVTPPSSLPLA
ncbi:MAG: amidase family protein [Acidobacteriota bacterium]